MNTTQIEVPTELLEVSKTSPEEAALYLALALYQEGRIPYEHAKKLSGNPVKFGEIAFSGDANQMDLNEFLSWASHDLKTPLNAVIGFTKVVLKGIDGPLNELQSTDIATAHGAGQKMLTYISNLVDIARLNLGKVKLSPETVQVEPFANETAARWRAQNPNKSLEVSVNIHTPTVQADPSRLRQAISGLLNFAAMHVKDGGRVSFNAEDNGEGVSITVQSEGETARDKPEMDTAMLKFITERLIELHHGRIEMVLETENGVLINLFIPYDRP